MVNDVTRTPGWSYRHFIYKLVSGEAEGPPCLLEMCKDPGVEADLGGQVLEAGPFCP